MTDVDERRHDNLLSSYACKTRVSGTQFPLKALQKEYGFTVEHIVAAARDQLALAPQA